MLSLERFPLAASERVNKIQDYDLLQIKTTKKLQYHTRIWYIYHTGMTYGMIMIMIKIQGKLGNACKPDKYIAS